MTPERRGTGRTGARFAGVSLAAVLGAAAAQEPRPALVEGRVVDPLGLPIEAARVRGFTRAQPDSTADPEHAATAVSDGDGRFELRWATAADCTLIVDHPDFVPRIAVVRWPAPDGAAPRRDIALGPLVLASGAELTVRAHDPGGSPVAAARVALAPALVDAGLGAAGFDALTRLVAADRLGAARFAATPAGSLRVTVSAPGFVTATRDLTVRDLSARSLLFHLTPAAGVHGRITTADGAPAAGALATFTPVGGGPRTAVRAGDDGHFRADTLPPAARTAVHVQAGPRSGFGWVEPSPAGPVELRAGGRAMIRGVVVDAAGAPVAAAEVAASPALARAPAAGREPAATGRSGAGGVFELTGLSAGRFTVLVRSQGHAPASFGPFRARAGGDDPVELRLGPTAARDSRDDTRAMPTSRTDASPAPGTANLRGVVEGLPAAHCPAALVCLDSIPAGDAPVRSMSAAVSGDGAFVFRSVPAGRYRLFYYLPERNAAACAADRARSLVIVGLRDGAEQRITLTAQ